MLQKTHALNKALRLILILSSVILTIYCIQVFGIEKLKLRIEEMGALAPLGIFILRFTSITIPALPSTAYSILSGLLLGFKKGLIVICLADICSCSLSFFLSRYYGRSLIKKLVGNKFMNRVERFSQSYLENNIFLMTGLLMTGLFDFVSYGIGLTKTPWTKFLPALIISIILSNPPVVALGAGLLNRDNGSIILIFALFGMFILSIITGLLKKRRHIS